MSDGDTLQALRAALTHRDIEVPKTHSGLIARFGETFVRSGDIPSSLRRLLNQAEHLTIRKIHVMIKNGDRFDPLKEFSEVARDELSGL